MAKLNADEQKLLAELQARAAAPEEDSDFEIEVYDTNAGKGARIPYARGKSWLYDVFGIGEAPASSAGEDGGVGKDAPPAGTPNPTAKTTTQSGGYFSRGGQ